MTDIKTRQNLPGRHWSFRLFWKLDWRPSLQATVCHHYSSRIDSDTPFPIRGLGVGYCQLLRKWARYMAWSSGCQLGSWQGGLSVNGCPILNFNTQSKIPVLCHTVDTVTRSTGLEFTLISFPFVFSFLIEYPYIRIPYFDQIHPQLLLPIFSPSLNTT